MDLLFEVGEDGSGEIEYGEFCQLSATFLVEDPDIDTMRKELKDAFRVMIKKEKVLSQVTLLENCLKNLYLPLNYLNLQRKILLVSLRNWVGAASMDFDTFCEMMMTKSE